MLFKSISALIASLLAIGAPVSYAFKDKIFGKTESADIKEDGEESDVEEVSSDDTEVETNQDDSVTAEGDDVGVDNSEETTQTKKEVPEKKLSDSQTQIQKWIEDNYSNCKIKIKTSEGEYKQYHELEESEDLSGLYTRLSQNTDHYKSSCKQGDLSQGRTGDYSSDVIDGVIFKQENGEWTDDDEDVDLEE